MTDLGKKDPYAALTWLASLLPPDGSPTSVMATTEPVDEAQQIQAEIAAAAPLCPECKRPMTFIGKGLYECRCLPHTDDCASSISTWWPCDCPARWR